MSIRLGEVMVRRGLLTNAQVEEILEEQVRSRRPFGLIAEQLFNIEGPVIEQAWAEQYAEISGAFDLDANSPQPEAIACVSRRQAWQFSVLPVRFEGAELVMATTRENLPRALRFATRVLERPCYLVLVDSRTLDDALGLHYPMPGMDRARSATQGQAVA